ncbi:MAG: GAF domain-containing protein [Anaerolineae bacterium]|nr:GAF domain-containing protein [Anaerolineae bacterium]
MSWHLSSYAIPLILGTVVVLSITLLSWHRRSAPGAIYLGLISLAIFIYLIGYIMELGSTTLEQVRFWLKFEYLGVVFFPALILALVLDYTGNERYLTAVNMVALFVIPVFVLAFAWTNDLHGMIWNNMRLIQTGDQYFVTFDKGIWYWAQVGYYIFSAVIGVVLVAQHVARSEALYRNQSLIVLIGLTVPLITYALYQTGITPTGLDTNSYALTITCICIAIGLFGYKLFDIVPVARDALLASMGDAVIITDSQHRILELNPAARRLAKPGLDQVIGMPTTEVLPDWIEVIKAYENVEEAHEEISITFEGEERHYDLRITPLKGQRRGYVGRLIILRDITEPVKVQMELTATLDRLRTLRRVDHELTRKLDITYVLDIAIDAALRLSLADAAFIGVIEGNEINIVHALGHYPPGVIDKPHPIDQGIAGRVIREQQAMIVRDVTAVPDYVAIIPETKAQISVPLRSNRGLIGLLTIETEYPERFSDEVFESVKMLAARVAVAIDNANAYEERDKLVKELDAFAHTVAHDLKNPLGLIRGYSQLLLEAFDDLDDETFKQYLRYSMEGADKAIDIIQALLLLAGVRTMEELTIGPVPMEMVVEEVIARMGPLCDEYEVEIEYANEWPVVKGYAPWIEEIWVNYISNALKYGGDPPRVELGYDRAGDGMIRFWVKDNGKGLTGEQQEKLFRPFTRLVQANLKGHGLGLSIVQRITERLDGEVGVESKVGEGSLFYFILPEIKESPK